MMGHRLSCGVLVLVVVALCGFGCTTGDGALELTFLGNEGFLLRAGGKSVLIDAITGDSLTGYVPLPAEPRAKLEAAQPPFGLWRRISPTR